MTINDTTTKNNILTQISTAMGAGGTAIVKDSGAATLATLTGITFAAPSGGSMTFTSTASSSNAATGTLNTVQFKTSGATLIATLSAAECTVTGSIALGGSLTETSGTISL